MAVDKSMVAVIGVIAGLILSLYYNQITLAGTCVGILGGIILPKVTGG